MNSKTILTRVAVDFELILNWTRAEFVDHLKRRLIKDPESIEALHYTPEKIEGGKVVVYIRAHLKTALETGSGEEVRDSVIESGAVLPKAGTVYNYRLFDLPVAANRGD